MKHNRDPLLFVHDILNSIGLIRKYLEGYDYAMFLANQEKQDAVVRNFEIVGEALKNVDKYFPNMRDKYVEIQWSHIIGMRDYIAHEYFSLDKRTIWETYQHDLDIFERQIQLLLVYVDKERV